MRIDLVGLRRAFGSTVALDDVSFQVKHGELLGLLGPSGSGKTTLLRTLAGLEVPDRGTVSFDGVDVTRQPVGRREIGFVFQSYALFPHLTVAENVAFALSVRGERKSVAEARVRELLALVRLQDFAQRLPAQLSGGQRQRVALARALAPNPKALLLDEPFGALDAQVRQELREWLRRLHDTLEVTTVFVTHDQAEAFEVADRVVLLNHGKVEQVGTPAHVYDEPASEFVLNFLGGVNVLHGQTREGVFQSGELRLPNPGPAGETRAYLRYGALRLSREPSEQSLPATLRRAHRLGALTRLTVDAQGATLKLEVERGELEGWPLEPGAQLHLTPQRARFYPV